MAERLDQGLRTAARLISSKISLRTVSCEKHIRELLLGVFQDHTTKNEMAILYYWSSSKRSRRISILCNNIPRIARDNRRLLFQIPLGGTGREGERDN